MIMMCHISEVNKNSLDLQCIKSSFNTSTIIPFIVNISSLPIIKRKKLDLELVTLFHPSPLFRAVPTLWVWVIRIPPLNSTFSLKNLHKSYSQTLRIVLNCRKMRTFSALWQYFIVFISIDFAKRFA